MQFSFRSFIRWILLIIVVVAALIAAGAVGYYANHLFVDDNNNKAKGDQGAVVANGIECSKIGSDILKQNGTAADAMIATMFCEGVACAQSAGLGGGFIMNIYIKHKKRVETLFAREVAPLAATVDMFANEQHVTGPKSIGVPGELKGYWELHQRHGRLPWAQLIQPTIDLCRNGHTVSKFMGQMLIKHRDKVLRESSLAEVYVNSETGDVFKEGQKIKRPKLAETLEILAREGAASIYNNGTIGQLLIKDIQKLGGIITTQDLMEYNVRWEEPVQTKLPGGNRLYALPPPASGAILVFIINVLNGFISGESKQSYIRIAETFKYAYAKRSELADPRFADVMELVRELTDPAYAKSVQEKIEDDRTFNSYSHYGANFSIVEDHGTANIVVIAPNGDAIVATSTVNTVFGAKIRSKSTGIILNDGMDDFSTPGVRNAFGLAPSPANFIVPRKMALSSMTPTIILDENYDVRLAIGAAGGSKITTSVAYGIIRYLYFNETIRQALHAPRIHHQLIPMELAYEEDMDADVIHALHDIGHRVTKMTSDGGFAAATAIARDGNKLTAVSDRRRLGSVSIF